MSTRNNFFYLKNTTIEKYYRELIKAENVSVKKPEASKFIVRKVTEDLIRTIAFNNSIDRLFNFNELMDKIERILPENIYDYVNIIRINTSNTSDIKLKRELIRDQFQLIALLHVVLVWYLKNVTEEIDKNKVIKYEAPTGLSQDKSELYNLQNQISQIDVNINELRSYIINGNNNLNEINNIREKINELKLQRNYLEPIYTDLITKIKIHEEDLLNVDNYYESARKKMQDIDNEVWWSYQGTVNKERTLINIEQEKREIDALMKQLEQKNDTTEWNEKYLVINLDNIRENYKKISELTDEYHKVLEEIKFSYDAEQEKLLEKKRTKIRTDLNFEDKTFNEKTESYLRNMNAIKSKTMILKQMFYDTTLNNSIHREFARSFFYLEGMQLRVFYTILTKMNNISVFINKSKDMLSKSNNEVFLNYIKDNAKLLENTPDEEIKLKIYYRLMEITKLKFRPFDNRLEFIKTLDDIVDKAYDILSLKKDFQFSGTKVESIKSYYLNKIKRNNSNGEIITEKNLINFVYNFEFVFNQNRDEELVPFFVMQCVLTDRKSYDREYNIESHEKMIEFWRGKQEIYSMILSKEKQIESELITLLKEKQEINKKINSLSKAKSELVNGHAKYDKKFRDNILKSEKISMLPSYSQYESALIKKQESDNIVNEAKSKFGVLKSVLSPDMWKNQSERFINNSNLAAIEKQLIEEAKQNEFFKDEFYEFNIQIGKADDISEIISQQKALLKEKNEIIEKDKAYMKDFQKKLSIIKEEYPDMMNKINVPLN